MSANVSREHAIGDSFLYYGKRLCTVKDVPTGNSHRCMGCIFLGDPYCGNHIHPAGRCRASQRADHQNVKFVKERIEMPQNVFYLEFLK